MAYSLDGNGRFQVRLGESVVELRYRRPEPAELIAALARKMPRGEEAEDWERVMLANLELGRACVEGVGEGFELEGGPLASEPGRPGYRADWRERLGAAAPLGLIALGQYLSAPPAFVAEPALNKTSPTPA